MFVEFGHFSLILAMVVAVVVASMGFIGVLTRNDRLMAVVEPGAIILFGLLLLSFLILVDAFIGSDFSLAVVWNNSHGDTPLIYRIAGTWGNHEGSMLLWVVILALFGAGVALFGAGRMPLRLRVCALAIQDVVGVAFLGFIVVNSNPFERLYPAPIEGRGLNPILQDFALAFHPPLLYLGYVGFSIVFSFAGAALITGKFDARIAEFIRPWALLSWAALTLGIAVGSYWAYYELGWGGWWFWDPVENASLMPWLVGTALLHSLAVTRKRKALKTWSVFLAIMAFSLSLFGTFLVRSGILVSVHAFANDPDRGVVILFILCFLIGSALTIFAIRASTLKGDNFFQPLSREGMLVVNNLFLSSATVVVFTGTLYPIVLEVLSGDKISVGAPFYHISFIPLAVTLLALMPIGASLNWQRGDLVKTLANLTRALAISLGLSVLLMVFLGGYNGIGSLLAVGLGLWIIIATSRQLVTRIAKAKRTGVRRLCAIAPDVWAMILGHVGIGVCVLGIAASWGWQAVNLTTMKVGDQRSVGPYSVKMIEVNQRSTSNYREEAVKFAIFGNSVTMREKEATKRYYPVRQTVTSEYAITTIGFSQVYLVISEADGDGLYTVRMWYKPFVLLIWLGGVIMAGAGLVLLASFGWRSLKKNIVVIAKKLKT